MKTLFTFLLIASFCIINGQNLRKSENIRKQTIAELFKPQNAVIVHQIIETNIWEMETVIITFYESKYLNEDKRERKLEKDNNSFTAIIFGLILFY